MTNKTNAKGGKRCAAFVVTFSPPLLVGFVVVMAILLQASALPKEAVLGFGLLAVLLVGTVLVAVILPRTFNDSTGHCCLLRSSSVIWSVYESRSRPPFGQQPNVPYGYRKPGGS